MRTVNVGIVVLEQWVITMRVYYRLENANLVAVSDVSERSKKVCKKYDTRL